VAPALIIFLMAETLSADAVCENGFTVDSGLMTQGGWTNDAFSAALSDSHHEFDYQLSIHGFVVPDINTSCEECAATCNEADDCNLYACNPSDLTCVRFKAKRLQIRGPPCDYGCPTPLGSTTQVNFCTRNANVIAAGSVLPNGDHTFVKGDEPFVPEVLFEGAYHPVCGLDFADNNEGASAICREVGFDYGGVVKRTNAVFDQDAVAIGKCREGESIVSCTGGGNHYQESIPSCASGQQIGVEITCHYKCRKLEYFNEAYLENCFPYLNEDQRYHVADTPFMDDASGSGLTNPEFSLQTQMTEVIKNAMNSRCAANVVQSMCNSLFRGTFKRGVHTNLIDHFQNDRWQIR